MHTWSTNWTHQQKNVLSWFWRSEDLLNYMCVKLGICLCSLFIVLRYVQPLSAVNKLGWAIKIQDHQMSFCPVAFSARNPSIINKLYKRNIHSQVCSTALKSNKLFWNSNPQKQPTHWDKEYQIILRVSIIWNLISFGKVSNIISCVP